ncbi:MAG: DUF4238 domain-containing protein [Acidobacteria bacterium]|nr:DUF4238 domain-containing protein [Acidobacteriota bacterium]
MKGKREQNKHKHHKQPQFYLKGFVAEDEEHPNTPSLWIYKRGEIPKRKGISNAAFTKDFYAFKENDGSINFNKYEDLLMRDFEQPTNSILEKLRRFEMIDEAEKEIFSRYVASMITRSDWAKNIHFKTVEEIASSTNEKYQETFKKEENKIKINEIIINAKENLKHGEFFPKSIISMAEKASGIIKKMNWRFLVAPDNMPFLTSDKPVFYTKLDEKGSEVIFPISSKVMLSASWIDFTNKYWKKVGNAFWKVNDQTVETERKCIVSVAIKEVYFSEKVDWLVKFVNNRIGSL